MSLLTDNKRIQSANPSAVGVFRRCPRAISAGVLLRAPVVAVRVEETDDDDGTLFALVLDVAVVTTLLDEFHSDSVLLDVVLAGCDLGGGIVESFMCR